MKQTELLDRLIELLCRERNVPVPDLPNVRKPDYFRAQCNLRPPRPVSAEFLRMQDEYLSMRTQERGIVRVDGLKFRNRLALWQGDITRLDADAIVNACNPALLGCFQPLHNCIDNIIHSNAGVQVRRDCAEQTQGVPEPNGSVRVTPGYNLPCRYIFHTVGPCVSGEVTQRDRADLRSCYLSCLDRARELGLSDVAFCCLSTGVYRFPRGQACALAVDTVSEWLREDRSGLRVVFDVFLDEDAACYRRQLEQ